MTSRLNRQVLEDLLTGPDGPVARYLATIGRRTASEAKRLVGRDTGRGAASIDWVLITRAGRLVVIIGSDVEYLRYHHDGTGIFGPRKRRIYPVTAKALKFLPKRTAPTGGRGPFVFRKSVAGSPPNPFLTQALHTVMGRMG